MRQQTHTGTPKKTRKQLEQENIQLQSLAERDGLTGLYNRTAIERMINDHLRQQLPGTMLVLDLDHFKQVNDRYGHITGDMLLCTIAHILQKMFGGRNLTGRVGGDEFVIFIPELLDESTLRETCQRIRSRFREIHLDHSSIHLNLSVTVDGADTLSGKRYRDIFDCADQKIVAQKRLRNMKKAASLPSRLEELSGIQPDMSLIARELEEQDAQPGAFFQDYETFKYIYRLEERRLRRSKKRAFVILFTLTDCHNRFLSPDERDAEIGILGDEICRCLRMGDIFTQYSSCQYLVLLLDVSVENVDAIAERISNTYYEKRAGKKDTIILHHSYPLKPAEHPETDL